MCELKRRVTIANSLLVSNVNVDFFKMCSLTFTSKFVNNFFLEKGDDIFGSMCNETECTKEFHYDLL